MVIDYTDKSGGSMTPVTDKNIKYLKGVGEKRAQCFNRLGIFTIGDLLRHYPRTYEDFSSPVPIAGAQVGQKCCIRAVAASEVSENMIRRGMTLYKLRAADDTGSISITFFNNRYIKDLIKEGGEYLFLGKIGGSRFKKELLSPEFFPAGESGKSAGLQPVYPLTQGLTTRMIRSAVSQALKIAGDDLQDSLPDQIRREFELCHLRFALENIHFPKNKDDIETARARLVFEELLILQLGMLSIRNKNKKTTSSVCTSELDFTAFQSLLPFELTNAQKKAIREAAEDMRRPTPMNRLLQGDVGSGKTAVAAALCFYAYQNGLQSALMAPTEILARQHFETLSAMLTKAGLRVGLLTGSLPAGEKRKMAGQIKNGEIDLAVGTHALLQKQVEFKNLGLVVTDEQHRFGVSQRAMIEKGRNPHVLVMSATPIPRTLALIVYGDLDISVLEEMPKGRLPVLTYAVETNKRRRIYNFIKKHLDQGYQAYIVCALIEEGESGLEAAESYMKKIAKEDFSGYKVGLLHGRMKGQQKDSVMEEFVGGHLQLLVSTTVIEVGVDVRNAVVMVIENAERFGLSQLHQLRGRVGRGDVQSYCILVSDARNGGTAERLKALCKTTDGFKIAEADLELRGPGDFFGQKQHGLPELKIADLFSDMPVLKQTQQAAHKILEMDPSLSLPEDKVLKNSVNKLFGADNSIVFN